MSKSIYKKSFILSFFAILLSNVLVAQSNLAEQTALDHFRQNLEKYQLTEADIANYRVSDNYVTKHNGVNHFYIIQEYEGIEVYNAISNFNILPSGEVLSMYNRFVGDISNKVNTTSPQISMENAIEAMMVHFDIVSPAPIYMTDRVNDFHGIFENAGLALEPIDVKLVYQKTENGDLRLAWNVHFYTLDAQNWWITRVDAVTGEILDYNNWVVHCDFGAPDHTCTNEAHDHDFDKVSIPEATTGFMPPVLNGNTNIYNALPLQIESPNHGDRVLLCDPADEEASPFGWHDIDGEEGAEYTITRGNNVHAYQDAFSLNQSIGDEPDGGDSLVFDFAYNPAQQTPFTELAPAVTNLFVWNNFMHDWWYHYGFDEASGNFQETNYTNEGQDGDYVNAEALDGSGTNNANFGTPADGGNPRMQMYYWGSGNPEPEITGIGIEVLAPASVEGFYQFQQGGFGADVPSEDNPLIGQVVLVVDDGANPNPNDACESITNGDEIEGNIAMIDRGDCEFGVKCLAAEEVGAIAVIICNNDPDGTIVMGAGAVGNQVTIPSVMVSLADCNTIKMGLPNLEVSLAEGGTPEFVLPDPGPSGLDSDFDNGIIAHEYGHGISNRLTGGPNQAGCLGNFYQQGEGWSDWFGLVMTHTAGMTAEQGRGIGTYATDEPVTGGGIREFRYSRNMNINPHTFSAVIDYVNPTNGQPLVHGIGSVWCVMIWDLYWNLIDLHGFDEDFYNGTGGNNIAMQLVMDGLKFQPCSPNFLEARDAIIEADEANYDGAHLCLIWETFARRGLGFSAEPGGVEAFDINPLCFNAVRIVKEAPATADAGDILNYNLQIINGTPEDLTDFIVTDMLPAGTSLIEGSLSCPGTVDGNILTIDLGAFQSGGVTNCSYQLQTSEDEISYIVDNDALQIGSSSNWQKGNAGGDENWSFSPGDAATGGFAYYAENVDFQTDQYLIWKDELILNDDHPAIGFWHKYETEFGKDGGVFEVSVNGGDWQDLGMFALVNGYNGMIDADANSALAGRQAFTGNSGEEFTQTIFDLTEFSGETIQVRFRFATDDAGADIGWRFDDFEIFGNIAVVENVACLVDHEGEEVCDETYTILFGDPSTNIIDKVLESKMTLFPNPTKGQFTIQFSELINDKVELDVMNVSGQTLISEKMNSILEEEIDLSEFGAGVYFVRIKTNSGLVTKKIVVQ